MPHIAIKASKIKLDADPRDGGYITGLSLPDSTLNVTVENFSEYQAATPEESYAHVDLIAIIEVADDVVDAEPEDEAPKLHLVPDNKPRAKGGRSTKT